MTDSYTVAAAYRLVGDVRKRSGNGEAAREAWSAGYAQLPQNVTESPMEMNERAELLRRLGRTAEADPVVARLRVIGFKAAM